MRATIVAVLACAGMARAEMVYVVETTDLQKKSTLEIKTGAELKELKKTIDAEARVFPKAFELVKKEWEAGDKGAPPAEKPKPGEKIERPPPPAPFPGNMLAPRKCQEKGSFTDRDKAAKRQQQLEDSAMEAITKEAKKKQGQQLTDKEKAKLARDNERQLAADRAATTLQAKIDDLIKNPPGAGGAATNAAPAAAPAAK